MGGVMTTPGADDPQISLSDRVTTVDLVKIGFENNTLNYSLEKTEQAFAYQLDLRYTDRNQSASKLIINNVQILRQGDTKEKVISYTSTTLRVHSTFTHVLNLQGDTDEYQRSIIVAPEGNLLIVDKISHPLTEAELRDYNSQANMNIGQNPIRLLNRPNINGMIAE
jgi:hypothetical protein